MNRKPFFILIVLGLLVGGLGFYLYNQRKGTFTASSFDSGQKVLKDFPLNDVARVRIVTATNELNLARGEAWGVKERWDYPANFSDISEFLRKAWELKPVQEVEAGPSQYGRLELLNPVDHKGTNAGTLIEFKDGKDSMLKSLVLGKKFLKESAPSQFGGGGEWPVGRYILVPGSPAKVWLVSEAFANIEAKPESWLSKDFLKVEKIQSVTLTHPANPEGSWSIRRETESGEWKLADAKEGENFDASKASGLNFALSSPSFNDVVSPDAKPEETGLAQPTVAKLETFEGFAYTVQIGKTNDDAIYLKASVEGNFPKERTPGADEKPEDKEKLDKEFKEKTDKLQEKLKSEQAHAKWAYLVSKWTVDALLKERKEFMAEKKAETPAPAAEPAPLEVPPVETIPPELKNLPVPPLPERKPENE